MALGFKVADGYVEVHARYDKGELQRAAQQAADDNDRAFNKERERNAKSGETRNSNRRIGAQANKDWVAGVREQANRNKENPFISVTDVRKDMSKLGKVSAREFSKNIEEGFVKEDGRFLRAGRRVSAYISRGFHREFENTVGKQLPRYRRLGRRIADAMFGKDNAGKAGANFFKSFVEAISFGQADFSRPEIAGKLTKWGSRMGSVLGVALAASLVFEIGNGITALLPVVLGGAILALPIADLIARNVQLEKGKLSFKKNNVGAALKDLIRTGQKLADTLGKAFSGTFITGLQHATMLMKALVGPMERAVKAVSPGALAMWNGLLQAIMTFGMAFQPALKGINAGLKEWGVQLPIIGRKLGEMFAQILSKPQLVRNAVQGLSGIIQGLIGFVGKLVYFLTVISAAYDVFNNLRRSGQALGASWLALSPVVGRLVAAWKPLKKAILDVWDALVKFASSKNDQQAVQRLKTLVERIKAVWKPLKHFLGEVWKAAWAKIKEIFNTQVKPWIDNTLRPWLEKKLKAAAKWAFNALVDAAKGELKKLPGKVKGELGKIPGIVKDYLKKAANRAIDSAKDLVNGFTTWVKKLPGKAASALSNLWGRMRGAFSSAVSNAKAKGRDLLTGFINAIKSLPSKAAAVVGKAKSAIIGKFSGAIGWLKSAGANIARGLASGISSGLSWVTSAARRLASAAVSAAKSALHISSPSKVFAEEVGKPSAQGIVQGIERNLPKNIPGLAKYPAMAMAGGGGSSSVSNTWNPSLNVNISEGLNPINAAARRALIRELFLELEQYRKDYVR